MRLVAMCPQVAQEPDVLPAGCHIDRCQLHLTKHVGTAAGTCPDPPAWSSWQDRYRQLDFTCIYGATPAGYMMDLPPDKI